MESLLPRGVLQPDGVITAQPQAIGASVQVDSAIASYEKVSGISGNLNSVGSDTLNNLMTFWGEAFQKLYPNVKMQVKGEGSATAPPALTEGTAQLGPCLGR